MTEATDSRPTPAPALAPPPGAHPAAARDSGEEFVEGAQRIAHAAASSPLLAAGALRVVLAIAGLGGGGFGVGTWSASTSATRQYEELTKKLDLGLEGLSEMHKTVDTLNRSWLEASTRAEAQRHEERLRTLEAQGNQLRLDLEVLKKERSK